MFQEYAAQGVKAILLCTTQRTGSTMLCEQMRATGELGYPGETLLPVTRLLRKNKTLQQPRYETYFSKGLQGQVYALKVMYRYAALVGKYLAADPDPLTSLYKTFAPATWVYLKREDRLGQAISRFFNIRTAQSHRVETHGASLMGKAKPISTDYNRHVDFDYLFLLQLREEIDADNQGWEDFFTRFALQPIRLVYEEIVDRHEHLNQIAQASGIGLHLTQLPETGLRPVRNQYSQKMRQLFESVQATLGLATPTHQNLLQATLQALDAQCPEKNEWYFFQKAMALTKANEPGLALESLEAGLATMPDFVEYYVKLAHLRARVRDGRQSAEASVAQSRLLFAADPESLTRLDNYLFHTYLRPHKRPQARHAELSAHRSEEDATEPPQEDP